ncbi:cell wall anchor protein [Streptococcus suis]|nr:cell wall anchor protein [Streptococcus suis]
MTNKQLITTLAVSTLVLAQAGLVSADEITPTDPSQPATEVVTPTDSVLPVETPDEQPSQPTEPTSPVDEVTPTDPSQPTIDSTTSVPTQPVEDDTSPSPSDDNSTSSEDTIKSDQSKIESGSDQPSKVSDINPALPKEKKEEVIDNGDGTKTISTEEGETVKLDTDKSKPTDNAKVTAEQAKNAGASQVGTTSKVTGQVVSNVTANQSLTLANGNTIVSILEGVAVLDDGSQKELTSLGAVKNSDGTYSVTTKNGENVTLPETGDEILINALVSLIGLGFLTSSVALLKKKYI